MGCVYYILVDKRARKTMFIEIAISKDWKLDAKTLANEHSENDPNYRRIGAIPRAKSLIPNFKHEWFPFDVTWKLQAQIIMVIN